jgi:hypothetical protein
MSLVLQSSGGGQITIQEPATASNFTQDLPAVTGNVVIDSATQTLTNKTLTTPTLTSPTFAGTPTGVGVLTSGTAVATTSGSSVVFTGIPSWVKRITFMFSDVSTNGATSPMMVVQIGSGSLVTTGYLSACTTTGNGTSISSFTNGFAIRGDSNPAAVVSGTTTLTLFNASTNTWVQSGVSAQTVTPYIFSSAGVLALSGALDRVALVTADTFDAGSINILYE